MIRYFKRRKIDKQIVSTAYMFEYPEVEGVHKHADVIDDLVKLTFERDFIYNRRRRWRPWLG